MSKKTGCGKVYSYLRFSNQKQAEGHSAERQTEYAEKWAREHNMQLDRSLTMRDEGLSAYHARHVSSGALGVFLRSIEQGLVEPGSVLIVEGLDRLSRVTPNEAMAQLSQIINAGITVVTLADHKQYSRESLKRNPWDLLYSLMVMIRAHEESDTKSTRVKRQIIGLCEKWVAGTYRGVIRNGADPEWVQWNGKAFELIESEAVRVRRIIELYLLGYGAVKINGILEDEGMRPASQQGNLYRYLRATHLLIGARKMTISIPDEPTREFTLEGYYPAVIDDDLYAQIVLNTGRREFQKRGPDSGVPTIVAGLTCGYCGRKMHAQNIFTGNKNPDGSLLEGHRRFKCQHHGCPTATIKAGPIERAIFEWCSDDLNLAGLVKANNGEKDILARIAKRRLALADLERQSAKLVEVMLATDTPPEAFVKKANELEKEILQVKAAIKHDEALFMRHDKQPTAQASEEWAKLRGAALAFDYEARMRVRKLCIETFMQVVVYKYGANARSGEKKQPFELVLIGRSGVTRHIRVDHTGRLIATKSERRKAR